MVCSNTSSSDCRRLNEFSPDPEQRLTFRLHVAVIVQEWNPRNPRPGYSGTLPAHSHGLPARSEHLTPAMHRAYPPAGIYLGYLGISSSERSDPLASNPVSISRHSTDSFETFASLAVL